MAARCGASPRRPRAPARPPMPCTRPPVPQEILEEEELRDAAILVYANKQVRAGQPVAACGPPMSCSRTALRRCCCAPPAAAGRLMRAPRPTPLHARPPRPAPRPAQDLPGALSDAAVAEGLGLTAIKSRDWSIFKTSGGWVGGRRCCPVGWVGVGGWTRGGGAVCSVSVAPASRRRSHQLTLPAAPPLRRGPQPSRERGCLRGWTGSATRSRRGGDRAVMGRRPRPMSRSLSRSPRNAPPLSLDPFDCCCPCAAPSALPIPHTNTNL